MLVDRSVERVEPARDADQEQLSLTRPLLRYRDCICFLLLKIKNEDSIGCARKITTEMLFYERTSVLYNKLLAAE